MNNIKNDIYEIIGRTIRLTKNYFNIKMNEEDLFELFDNIYEDKNVNSIIEKIQNNS